MEYLLAAVRKSSRRIRIEQWLLLAVRTCLVVLAGAGRGRAGARACRACAFVRASGRTRCWCSTARTRWPTGRPTRPGSSGPRNWPADRRGEPPGRRLHAGADGLAAAGGGRHARLRAAAESSPKSSTCSSLDGGADLPATVAKIEEVLDDGPARTAAACAARKSISSPTWAAPPGLPQLRRQRSGRMNSAAAASSWPMPPQWSSPIWATGRGQRGGRIAGRHRTVCHRRPRADARGRSSQFRPARAARGNCVELYVDGRRAGEDETRSRTRVERHGRRLPIASIRPGEHQDRGAIGL